MAIVTNIEGFAWPNPAAWYPVGFQHGGGMGAAGAPFVRTGAFCALTFGQGWVWLPLAYRSNGLPSLLPLAKGEVIIRTYFQHLFRPINPTRVLSLSKLPAIPPTFPLCAVEINAAGQLLLNGALGAGTVLNLNQWYRLELIFSSSAGAAVLLIDGIPETIALGAFLTVEIFVLGDERVTAGGFNFWDDVLVQSHANNPAALDLPGEGRVYRITCNADGTDNNWALVGAPTKSVALNTFLVGSYVECNNPPVGVAPDQTMQLTDVTADPNWDVTHTIRGAKVFHYTRNVVGNPDWRFARIRSGATVAETDMTLAATVNWVPHGSGVWQNDPDTGNAWTIAATQAMEAGLGNDDQADRGQSSSMVVFLEGGAAFPPGGRAKINPATLGPAGPTQINAPVMGA